MAPKTAGMLEGLPRLVRYLWESRQAAQPPDQLEGGSGGFSSPPSAGSGFCSFSIVSWGYTLFNNIAQRRRRGPYDGSIFWCRSAFICGRP
jgi:hypothetical protein